MNAKYFRQDSNWIGNYIQCFLGDWYIHIVSLYLYTIASQIINYYSYCLFSSLPTVFFWPLFFWMRSRLLKEVRFQTEWKYKKYITFFKWKWNRWKIKRFLVSTIYFTGIIYLFTINFEIHNRRFWIYIYLYAIYLYRIQDRSRVSKSEGKIKIFFVNVLVTRDGPTTGPEGKKIL